MTQYQSISQPAASSASAAEASSSEERPGESNDVHHAAADDHEDLEIDDYEYKRWCGVRRSTVLFVFYLVSYLTYLTVGGYIMSCLETPYVKDLKNEVLSRKEAFMVQHPDVNSKYIIST